jgi:hypothetical protein
LQLNPEDAIMDSHLDPRSAAEKLVVESASLAATNTALADRIRSLTERLDEKAEKEEVKKGQRKTLRVALGAYGIWIVELLVVLSFGSIILTQQAQIKNQQHSSCALYALFIKSYREESAARSPLGPEGYVAAFREIQNAADYNHCGIPHKVKWGVMRVSVTDWFQTINIRALWRQVKGITQDMSQLRDYVDAVNAETTRNAANIKAVADKLQAAIDSSDPAALADMGTAVQQLHAVGDQLEAMASGTSSDPLPAPPEEPQPPAEGQPV